MFIIPDGTAIIQLLNFAIFFAVLSVLLRPVALAVRKRRAYIDSLASDYGSYQMEAAELRKQAESVRAGARREAEQIIAKARADASNRAAELSGEENADEMRMGNDGKPVFLSNHAGGILGGISTGQPVIARFAVKPTSSILTPRRTVDRYGRETEISTTGRHDPCVGIRAVPVGEAMVACVIADHYLRHRGQVGEPPDWPFALPQH